MCSALLETELAGDQISAVSSLYVEFRSDERSPKWRGGELVRAAAWQ